MLNHAELCYLQLSETPKECLQDGYLKIKAPENPTSCRVITKQRNETCTEPQLTDTACVHHTVAVN